MLGCWWDARVLGDPWQSLLRTWEKRNSGTAKFSGNDKTKPEIRKKKKSHVNWGKLQECLRKQHQETWWINGR